MFQWVVCIEYRASVHVRPVKPLANAMYAWDYHCNGPFMCPLDVTRPES